ncbi:MAG: outer membrane beta-barrel family protein [Winogradskyella arenosi]
MIISLRHCFCVIFSVLSLSLFSQEYSVSGQVVDVDQRPIEFANVVVLNAIDEDYLTGTSTDETGHFTLERLEEDSFFLKISYMGFEDYYQKIELTKDLDLRVITLKETAETLGEVTVVAKKPTITRKPDRLVFNVENTALIEGSTLSVLKNTPGVIVTDGSINIKSVAATVYINDRRVQLTSEELIQLLDSAPANSIKSIEVITIPPSNYDSDSASVINIIMSKNLITGYRGSAVVNYSQGVFPRYNAATSHFFKNNKVNLNINYSYTGQKRNRDTDATVNYLDQSNALEEVWQSNVNRNTWSESHHLNLNFDYYFDDNNTLSLTSTGLYTPYFKYKIANRTDIYDENAVFQSGFTADNLSRDNKFNIGTDLSFVHNFENGASLTAQTHYTFYDYDRDQNVLSNYYDNTDAFVGASEFNTIANQNTDIITGKLDYNLPFEDGSTIEMGLKYSNVNTDSDITRTDIIGNTEVINTGNTDRFNYDEKVFSAYTNYSATWEKWDMNLGLRLEQTNIEGESLMMGETNTQDYLNLFPNVSLLYNISDAISVYGNYKRSISRPLYTNLNPFTFYLNENTVVKGNPNLTPSYRNHYVIGTSFLRHFSVEAYYSHFDGDIVELAYQDNSTNIFSYTPTNLDRKVDYGFDFLFHKQLTERYYISAITSFFNLTEEVDINNSTVKMERWSNYSVLYNGLTFLEDNSLNVGLTLTWVGKNVHKLHTVEHRLFSDLGISKSIMNRKGVISLTIEDLFNLQDTDASQRYLNQWNSYFNDSDTRYIRLGFRYNFGNTKLNTNERRTSAEERTRLGNLR